MNVYPKISQQEADRFIDELTDDETGRVSLNIFVRRYDMIRPTISESELKTLVGR